MCNCLPVSSLRLYSAGPSAWVVLILSCFRLPTTVCLSTNATPGWWHKGQMVWSGSPCPLQKPPRVNCCYKQLNAPCSAGHSERTRGMYKVLEGKWRTKQEALFESFVQPHGYKNILKIIYKKRNRKRTTKVIIVTEQCSYMGRLTRAH